MKRYVLLLAAVICAVLVGKSISAFAPDTASFQPVALPIKVGTVVDDRDVHLVSRSGLYGLGVAPPGSRYAVVGNNLVRLSDDQTILAVIRAGIRPLNEDLIP